MPIKRKKVKESTLSPELDKLIRITDEMVEERLSNLPYKIHARPEEKQPRGKYWCVYCGQWKKFGKSKKKDFLSDYACETCNISLEDFYIKTHNSLWGGK